MNDKHTSPLSIRVFYVLSQIAFYFMILTGAAVLLFNILLYTNFFGENLQLHVHLPGLVNVVEQGELNVFDETVAIQLVEAKSRIHFVNTPLVLARPFGLSMLLIFGFGFYMVLLLRQFMRNVKNRIIFELKNIQILKRLAYSLLGVWLFTLVYLRLTYYWVTQNITVDGISITDEISNYPGVLLAALFLWVLAHIFEVGLKLDEEVKLTV